MAIARVPSPYTSTIHAFAVLSGIAIGILKNLSLGLGLRVLLRFHTDTIGIVNVRAEHFLTRDFIFNQTVKLGKESVFLGEFESMTLNVAPIVGLMYKVSPWLQLGFNYRGQNYLNDFGFTNPTIDLAGVLSFPQGYQFKFARYFTPHSFVWGAAVKPVKNLTVTIDIGYYLWHKFLDIEAKKPVPLWQDTVIPRIGVEYTLFDWWILRAGYYYYDSPVPNQSSSINNFLDNDKNVFSIGTEWLFNKPSNFWYKPIQFSLAVQYQQCIKRSYTKASAADPYYPGYTFGGDVLFATGQVSLHF